ncbi:MAG TPA: regulatory protein RecX [Steroidobacteraceae bacterium]|nr:regulatory protein RecX [Steroidobacteraceae bacterium]
MIRRRRKGIDPALASDLAATRRAAVGLLARRDFASSELREKLQQQGFEAGVVATAVEELVSGRILDDSRYADNYVAYHSERGQGPLRIAADLRALGLPPERIEAALASGPDWAARAREVRIRRFGLEPPADWAGKGRQARFLQYRGFSSDHIRSALGADFDPD